MGRTTTPVRQLITNYVRRLEKASLMMDPKEREAILKFLDDIDDTASLLSHEGVVDPLEVLITHLLRKLSSNCLKPS